MRPSPWAILGTTDWIGGGRRWRRRSPPPLPPCVVPTPAVYLPPTPPVYLLMPSQPLILCLPPLPSQSAPSGFTLPSTLYLPLYPAGLRRLRVHFGKKLTMPFYRVLQRISNRCGTFFTRKIFFLPHLNS